MRALISIVAALSLSACGWFWPHLPPEGTCRNFAITTWVQEVAPWNDFSWTEWRVIDEPMLTIWGWQGDLNNKNDVCGDIGLGSVQKTIDEIHRSGYKAWVNYSTEEWVAVVNLCTEVYPGLNAEVLSMDTYGGIWDWDIRTKHFLNHMYRMLAPGQKMGLVPEGHSLVGTYLDYPEIDYIHIGTYYLDWAMDHDDEGKIIALAPFIWNSYPASEDGKWPAMIGIKDKPRLIEFYTNVAAKYPRCQE